MKQFLFSLLFFLLGYHLAFGQQSGAQTLRLARSVYEQGRLHEIPDLINKNVPSFSKTELVDAYRLLTLAYIYLEEPEKADDSMQKLLSTDHFYVPNANVEPAEFVGLYKTFRTTPVFSYGFKLGLNVTMPLINNLYYVSNSAPGNGKYAIKPGFQVGVVFEKEFFSDSKNKLLRRLVFVPEAIYTSRTFDYANPSPFISDITGTSVEDQAITIKQAWLDINPVFQLRLSNSTTFAPYVGLGPGVSYLLSASNTQVSTRKAGVGIVSGPDVDFKDSYNKLVPSVIASAGAKYRFGDFYILGEVRVQYALTNPVDKSKRSIQESVFDYQYILPNYKPLNLVINLGIIVP
ncbi:MAG: outer membrane beta-barrel protein, partial [Bacteroidetes bacterium]|nr:outer membrane beta-barrel protein [Bacteroidota bacterium]